MLASATFAPPHASDAAMMRTLFVDAKFKPDICTEHPVVNVHCAVPVSAPFIVNKPTLYE
jgi:hypothetical protein